jgi:hypothetical protein
VTWRIYEGRCKNKRPFWYVENRATNEMMVSDKGFQSRFYGPSGKHLAEKALEKMNGTFQKRQDRQRDKFSVIEDWPT